MSRHEEVKQAVLSKIRQLQSEQGGLISIFDIGVPLVAADFTQEELADAIFELEREKVVEMLSDNRLRVLNKK